MRKRVIVKLLLLAKSGTISVVGWKEEGREGRGILGGLSKSRHDASLAPTKSLGLVYSPQRGASKVQITRRKRRKRRKTIAKPNHRTSKAIAQAKP
jgi:hypothetical protein